MNLAGPTIFFGFFFDGTKNNYVLADKGKNHSNVARLYDCYPGLSVLGVLPASTDWQYKPSNYTHFFKVYVPGVASPFKEVNDSGAGYELQRGAATGYKGEARITWALIQAINNIHRYFFRVPLVSAAEAATLVARINLSATSRQSMRDPFIATDRSTPSQDARDHFREILQRLHKAVAQHWPDAKSGRPKKVDPGIVKTIHLSVFGFSRGATQARAFTNWMVALCQLDASLAGRNDTMTLGGFNVNIDFLGLFDTVASVGAGNTFGSGLMGRLFDGHGAWADSEESLRIPPGIPCVHLVAAHELRRSFPLDSIAVGSMTPDNCSEVVFPGVHSDLGCGYSPCEQGRGTDPEGVDMLARVPLVYMYKMARLAGVPLKLELASDTAKKRFVIAPATLAALNDYLALATEKVGPLTAIMREQAHFQMRCRLARRAKGSSPLESTTSFGRASTFDQNDLHSANLEFEKEIAAYESWLAKKGKGFLPKTQSPGFGNDYEKEWEGIAMWWAKAPPPPAAMFRFFDEYVHDSRAWFKLIPGNPDSEEDMHALFREWILLRQNGIERQRRADKLFLESQRAMFRLTGRKQDKNSPKPPTVPDELTSDQRTAVDQYIRTKKIPPMLTEGREPFQWAGVSARAGYLRYRKVYGGRDSVLISDSGSAPSDGGKVV